jgi:integration host factor subunit beta
MKKSELIETIFKKYPHLSAAEVTRFVELIFNRISDVLINNDKIERRGFRSFTFHRRNNSSPSRGSSKLLNIGDKNIVYFKMSQDFAARLNPSNTNHQHV